MKQFWLTVFGSILGVLTGVALCLVLAAFALTGLMSSAFEGMSEPALPGADRDLVLTLDLREPRVDQPSASPLALNAPLSMVELSQALARAHSDSRVLAVFVRASETPLPAARAAEINALLDAISAAGKPVIVHAQGFEHDAAPSYWAVSAADALWMQDSALFLAGLPRQTDLETLPDESSTDVVPAPDWLDALQDSALGVIARNRELAPDTLRARLQAAPYTAQAALDLGLIDQLGHVADARQAVLDRIGTQAQFVDIADYHRQISPAAAPLTPVIALVSAQGPIKTGASETRPGLETTGGDTLAAALERAAQDPAVAAIILRIDSPGGSAIAADQIRDAVQRARQAGKPVIASLADRALAGGYFIATPADRILASASTLTGDIGRSGQTHGLSPALPHTPEQQAAYRALEEDVRNARIRMIAQGRDLPQARIQALARGQVWTGQQALELGLIDELGGFDAALASARQRAGLSPSQPVRVLPYPAPPEGLEALEALLGISLEGLQNAAALEAQFDRLQAQSMIQPDAPVPARAEAPEQDPL